MSKPLPDTVRAAALPFEALCAGWGNGPPVVSVICVTYNHAPYLDFALAGMMMQRTDFPFEVLVFDDASIDRTSDILRDWAARYPGLIRPFIRSENQFREGVMPRIFNIPEAQGRYLAICDGDDFWTDPTKLQRQADYLEVNPGIAITGHDAVSVDETGRAGASVLPDKHKDAAAPALLQRCERHIKAVSMMFRNTPLPETFERDMVINGDSLITTFIGAYGGYHYHPEIEPAGYRQHGGGMWSKIGRTQQMVAHANLFFWLACFYKRHGNAELGAVFEKKYLTKTRDLALQQSWAGRWRLWLSNKLRNMFREAKRLYLDAKI